MIFFEFNGVAKASPALKQLNNNLKNGFLFETRHSAKTSILF
ncbi:hypothetical protein T190607A02C_10075 [Tenacibaculum sp. 190524A02b]